MLQPTVMLYQADAPARVEAQPTVEMKPRGTKRRAAALPSNQRRKPAEEHPIQDVPLTQPHHGGWPIKRTKKCRCTCSPDTVDVAPTAWCPNSLDSPESVPGGAPTAKILGVTSWSSRYSVWVIDVTMVSPSGSESTSGVTSSFGEKDACARSRRRTALSCWR
jgi:hypothetical protein